jgi:hypothetical protein
MRPGLEKLFPRDVYGRIELFITSTVLGALGSAGCLAILFAAAAPVGWKEILIRIVFVELAITWTLFFACGFIWSIATPRWIESTLEMVTNRFLIALAVFMPFNLIAIWILMS